MYIYLYIYTKNNTFYCVVFQLFNYLCLYVYIAIKKVLVVLVVLWLKVH